MKFERTNRSKLRYYYTRYADDWLILGNYPKQVAEGIKQKLELFLKEELGATLSMEKKLMTDMREKHALFRGFELRIRTGHKYIRFKKPLNNGEYSNVLQRANTKRIVLSVDKQRRLNQMYIMGYCDEKGFSLSIPWLACLDSHRIIDRYNSVLRGLASQRTFM